MPSPLDTMNATELLLSSQLLMEQAHQLPKDDPKAIKLLRGAKQLLDRANSLSRESSTPGLSVPTKTPEE